MFFLGASTGALLLLAPAAAHALEADDIATVASSTIDEAVDTASETARDAAANVEYTTAPAEADEEPTASAGDAAGSLVEDTVDAVEDTVDAVEDTVDVVEDPVDTGEDPVDAVEDPVGAVEDELPDLDDPPATGGGQEPAPGPDSPDDPPSGEKGSGPGPSPTAHERQLLSAGASWPVVHATLHHPADPADVAAPPIRSAGVPATPPTAPVDTPASPPSPGFTGADTGFPAGLAALAIAALALLHGEILWLRMKDGQGPTDPFLPICERPG